MMVLTILALLAASLALGIASRATSAVTAITPPME
jgi:hypothetical protein